MSKIKKVLAVFLTLAMVLGMGMTTFAADESTAVNAKVSGIRQDGDNVTVTAYKIVELDKTSTTGYKDLTGQIADVTKIVTAELESIRNGDLTKFTATTMTKGESYKKGSFDVADYTADLTPGMYLIMVDGTAYVYNPMVLSVNLQDGQVTSTDTVAKPAEPLIEKTSDQEDVEIGKDVAFTIEATIPGYGPEYAGDVTFKITDTLSAGLTYNNDAEVTITGVEAGLPDVIQNGQILTAEFGSELIKNHPGEIVTITYTAKLNKDAVTNFNPNTNTVELEYTNNPDGSTFKKDDETKTYTFELDGNVWGETTNRYEDIYKTDSDVEEETDYARLEGAEFSLYTDAECTVEFAKAITDANGLLNFKGLDGNKEYYLKETKAPTGFQLNATPVKVVVTPTYDETDGKLLSYTVSFDDVVSSSYSATYEGEGTITKVDHTGAGHQFMNTKLTALPSTGGIGTTIFTIGGCLIMIIAAALFFASRRKNNK